jgi:hypothetical protein
MGELLRFPDEAESSSDERWQGRLPAFETVDNIIGLTNSLGVCLAGCCQTFGGSEKCRKVSIIWSVCCLLGRRDSNSSINKPLSKSNSSLRVSFLQASNEVSASLRFCYIE